MHRMRGRTVASILRGLRTAGDDSDGAAILRPALLGIAQRRRTFLAIGNRRNPRALDALSDQELSGRGGAAGGERDVVFARAAFVGVALDLYGDGRILLQPGGLAAQRFLGFRRQRRLVLKEENPVAAPGPELASRSVFFFAQALSASSEARPAAILKLSRLFILVLPVFVWSSGTLLHPLQQATARRAPKPRIQLRVTPLN